MKVSAEYKSIRFLLNTVLVAGALSLIPLGAEASVRDLNDAVLGSSSLPSGFAAAWHAESQKGGAGYLHNVIPVFDGDVIIRTNANSADLTWSTDVPTTAEIRFSTEGQVDVYSALVLDSELSTDHSVAIPDLSSNTKYYVEITAKDARGNTATSDIVKFRTKSDLSEFAPRALFRWWYNIN